MYNGIVETSHAERLTPVQLAFIGDAVHTLYVRERIVSEQSAGTGTLHTAASRLLSAVSQAAVYDMLVAAEYLTEAEADVGRRAKNAHLHSRAKTASPTEYHKATALEAIIGYVHTLERAERETELLDKCFCLGKEYAAQNKR